MNIIYHFECKFQICDMNKFCLETICHGDLLILFVFLYYCIHVLVLLTNCAVI